MITAAPKRRRLGDPEAQSMANVHKWGLLYGPRFPKSCLHEFYQVHGGTPAFSVEDGPPPPASPKFTCHLTIPAVHTPHGGFEETRFTAWARSKKAAEHSAAEKALEFITGRGLLQAPANPAVLPSNAANTAVGEMPLEEVRLLQQRLTILSVQLAAAGHKPLVNSNGGLPGPSDAQDDEALAPVNVDALSEEELRQELRKAQEQNASLRQALSREHSRRKAAVDALMGSPRD
ncbi:g7806 [Coccomyxa elongata]